MEGGRKSSKKSVRSWLYGFMLLLCAVSAATGSYFAFLFSRYSDFDSTAEHVDADAKAYRAAGWAWESNDIIEGPQREEDDGDPLFNKAVKQLGLLKTPAKPEPIMELINQGRFKEADIQLQPLAPILDEVKRAVSKQSLDLGIDPDRFGEGGSQILSSLRQFVRLLCLRARCRASDGREESAIDDLGVAWKLGVRTSRMPSTTAIMVGFSVEALVLGEVEAYAGKWINRPDLRGRLNALLGSDKDLPDIQRLYRVRAYEGLVCYRNFEHPIDALASSGEIPGANSGPGITSTHPDQAVRTGLPKESKSRAYAARHFQLWCEVAPAIRDESADPIALAKSLRKIADGWGRRQTGSAIAAGIESSALPEFATAIGRIRAQAIVTKALMAAMDVKQKTGNWPNSASQIPGTWDDPFSHQPLHVKSSKSEVRIYSLGPDMKDDGGTRRAELGKGAATSAYDIVASYPPYISNHI